MDFSLYQFADVSHHKGRLDFAVFAALGHRIIISKASDSYHLPDRFGKFDFSADRHIDSYFVDNFVGTREQGLVAGAYHFVRFDRPLPLSNKVQIVEKNLEYFQAAVGMLPAKYRAEVVTPILDAEQSPEQLRAAGLDKATVSDMMIDIFDLFLEHYQNLILYSGSWWSDDWLTEETTQYMAERAGVWEPEYLALVDNLPYRMDYRPSVPKGFSNEYALTAEDHKGKLFAWQYTAKGRVPGEDSDIDLNLTALPKSELYKLFGQEGSVDPPDGGSGDPGTGGGLTLSEIADLLDEALSSLRTDIGVVKIRVDDIWDKVSAASSPGDSGGSGGSEEPGVEFDYRTVLNWEKVDRSLWPNKVIDFSGQERRVAYVVATKEVPILTPDKIDKDKDPWVYQWEEAESALYGNTTRAKRIIPNVGRVIQVFNDGPQWYNPFKLNLFKGNGGAHAAEVTPFQTIDGKDLRSHPLIGELFIRASNFERTDV